MWDDDEGLVREVAASLGRSISDALVRELSRYAALVAEWNGRVNLTGAKDARALAEISFVDAIVLADLEVGPRVIDVGAGGGAPAIPLAILRPEIDMVMLEPRKKRAVFLQAAIEALGLGARVRVEQRKLAERDRYASRVDAAISRATFEPALWLAHGLALAPRVAVLGTGDPLPEHDGATLLETRAYTLPFSGARRQIGLYQRR